jgi:hypothetical protein
MKKFIHLLPTTNQRDANDSVRVPKEEIYMAQTIKEGRHDY